MKLTLIAIFALLTLGAAGENLVFNGGFELGETGFSLIRALRPDTNASLVFDGLECTENQPFSGRKALLVRNRFAEKFELHSKDFVLRGGTKYQVALAARIEGGAARISVIAYRVTQKSGWEVQSRGFDLTDTWQTFRFDFATGKEESPWHIQIVPAGNSPVAARNILLDNLTVTAAGDDAETAIDVAAVPADTLYDLAPGLKIPVQIGVHNPGGRKIARTVTVNFRDDHTQAVLATRSWPVTLAAGESARFDWEVPVGRYGSYLIDVTGDGALRSHPGYVAVIGKYEPRPIDIGKEFCVGVNDGLHMVYIPDYPEPAYLSFGASPDEKLRLFSRMGCRILRDHDAGYDFAAWSILEPARDRWDFSWVDRSLELTAKHKIVLLPVVGRSHFIEAAQPRSALRWPQWVTPLCERVTDDPPNVMKAVRGRILLPPIDLWAKYVAALGRRAEGKIRYFEIINEANLFLSADNYLKYLRSAHNELRKINPQNQIIGFCLSSDLGGNIDEFSQECFKKGGLDYADIVSFHPYHSRELGSVNPADKQIENLRKSIGNPKIGIWNTELYYIFEEASSGNSYGSMRCEPEHLAKRFLIDLGEGVGQSIAVTGYQMWKPMLNPGMFHQRNLTQLIPSGNYVVYNTMARLFEGAKTDFKAKLPQNVVVYGFIKDAAPIAAVWNFGKLSGLSSRFQGFRVMDLFGNVLDQPKYELAGNPYYLTMPGASPEAFREALKRIAVDTEVELSVSPVIRLVAAAEPRAMFAIKNNTGNEITGRAGIQGNGLAAVKAVPFRLAPNQETTLTVPVKAGSGGDKADIVVFANGKTLRRTAEVYSATVVRPSQTVTLSSGTDEFKAQFVFVREGSGLQLQITVDDAVPSGEAAGRKPWEQDCVELFFDPGWDQLGGEHPESYTDRVFRVFFTPFSGGEGEMTLWTKDETLHGKLKYRIVREEKRYQVLLDLPAEFAGRDFGFDLKVDNSGPGAKATQSLGWQNRPDNYKNRMNFGIVSVK